MKKLHAVTRFVGTLFATLFFMAITADASAAEKPLRAYVIKAAFLYDMAKSTAWPRSAGQTLDFCIHGPDPFGAASALIDGLPVRDRVLDVRTVDQAGDLAGCDMVFFGVSDAAEVQGLLMMIDGRSILTISEMPSFVQNGGMVRLKAVNNRLRFDINPPAIRRAGLIVSTDALELADSMAVDAAQSVQR